MINTKIAIIGCGNIGISLLQGLLKDEKISPENIAATRRNISELSYLKESGVFLTSDNLEAIGFRDYFFLFSA
jgi:pyrroline-5-carboxylate reductase